MSHILGSFQLQPLYGPGLVCQGTGAISLMLSTLPSVIFVLQLVTRLPSSRCLTLISPPEEERGCCFLGSLFRSEEIFSQQPSSRLLS